MNKNYLQNSMYKYLQTMHKYSKQMHEYALSDITRSSF